MWYYRWHNIGFKPSGKLEKNWTSFSSARPLNMGHILWPGRTGNLLQVNLLSLGNNRLKFETAGKLPINLEEFKEYFPNLIKEKRRMSTCNWLDLQTLGSRLIMPKNLPDQWSDWAHPLDNEHLYHRFMEGWFSSLFFPSRTSGPRKSGLITLHVTKLGRIEGVMHMNRTACWGQSQHVYKMDLSHF